MMFLVDVDVSTECLAYVDDRSLLLWVWLLLGKEKSLENCLNGCEKIGRYLVMLSVDIDVSTECLAYFFFFLLLRKEN